MLKIFTGEDRLSAQAAIQKFLGAKYEVIEGANLTPELLPSIFLGASLFAENRAILIRDLSENTPVYAELPQYLQTPHSVAIFETKLDKRLATYKAIKDQIEILDFPAPRDSNQKLVFDIYEIAKRDGIKAVASLRQIESTNEPIAFAGLLNSQAIKDFVKQQGTIEKQRLKILAKLDIDLKTSPIDPWLLIESALRTIAQLDKIPNLCYIR